MVRRGFTLVQLLVYLALLTGLSLMVFGFAARTYRFILERTSLHQFKIRMAMAGDLVRRDLMLASFLPADWDVVHATFKQVTMTSDGALAERWVGYQVDEKGLKRIDGIYNSGTQTWTEHSAALINAQVTTIALQPIIEQRATVARSTVIGVTVVMKAKRAEEEHVVVMTVALRNRVLG